MKQMIAVFCGVFGAAALAYDTSFDAVYTAETGYVTLEVLSKKRPGVKVRLVCKDRGKPTPTEIAKFNRQYKGLAVTYSDDFHDRFLIIDNVELHGLGSSINCLGRRVTSYATRDAKEIAKLLAMLP